MALTFVWRGICTDPEINRLHAEAFATPLGRDEARNWTDLLDAHSLGWVVARDGDALVGFVNVIWDGGVHAFLQDTMVGSSSRGQGVGTSLVDVARDEARKAGCEWLHVDFDDDLGRFYFEACGFRPTSAGLIHLKATG